MSNENRGNKGYVTTVLVIAGIILLIFMCIGIQGALEIKNSNESNISSSNVYQITRETGFYKHLYSEDYSETLKAGTRVKPANNSTYLSCQSADFDGISITSCLVEVISTGKTGWVLKNAISQ